MRHYTTILIGLTLALTACTSCSGGAKNSKTEAAPEPTPVDESAPVSLTFDWPTNLSGSVERQNVEEMEGRPAEQSSVVYTIGTRSTDAGVELVYTDPRDAKVPGASAEELAAMAPMFSAVPTIVLKNGKVVSIGNADAMRAIVDELAPIPPDAPADIKAQMAATRSDAFFLQAAQSEWATVTTVWHDQTLTPGKVAEARSKSELLGLSEPVETVITMSLVEWLDCPGTEGRRCVRLKYSSTPDPAALQAATESLVHNAARQGVKFELTSLKREFQVELVTEPTTLVPYSFESSELTELEATQNGQPANARRVKRRIENYTWTKR